LHNFSKVALLLRILNALTKLFIRFLAIGKPKRPACMAVENKFHSMCFNAYHTRKLYCKNWQPYLNVFSP